MPFLDSFTCFGASPSGRVEECMSSSATEVGRKRFLEVLAREPMTIMSALKACAAS